MAPFETISEKTGVAEKRMLRANAFLINCVLLPNLSREHSENVKKGAEQVLLARLYPAFCWTKGRGRSASSVIARAWLALTVLRPHEASLDQVGAHYAQATVGDS